MNSRFFTIPKFLKTPFQPHYISETFNAALTFTKDLFTAKNFIYATAFYNGGTAAFVTYSLVTNPNFALPFTSQVMTEASKALLVEYVPDIALHGAHAMTPLIEAKFPESTSIATAITAVLVFADGLRSMDIVYRAIGKKSQIANSANIADIANHNLNQIKNVMTELFWGRLKEKPQQAAPAPTSMHKAKLR